MARKGVLQMCVMVVIATVATNVEVTLASTQPNTASKSDSSRLQEVQEEFLNVVGNSTRSVKSVGDLMALLHSETGQQMGRLLMEGIMLGAAEKDVGSILSRFLIQFQGRLSPELQEALKNYGDLLGGLDMATLPIIWEKLFKKDGLGNSLAEMPLGQLVGLLQPTASRYGVDLNAFMNSVMGKGKNNLKDLVFDALDNLNVISLVSKFFNSTSDGSDVQTPLTTDAAEPERESKLMNEKKAKKTRGDGTLRLFRPLITSLLRENKIDLDADAVLEVLSPVLNGDMLSQATPILSALSSQAGDGLAPVIGNILGGEGGNGMQGQMGALLGGVGALLGGGGNQRMDLTNIMTMASMFMNNGNSNKGNKKKDMKRGPSKATKPDLKTLQNLAGKLAENNDIDVNSLLEKASVLLQSETKKRAPITSEVESEIPRPKRQEPSQEKTQRKNQKQATATSKSGSKPRHLIDMLEPIILSMQTDKQCNRKIKDAILFSKAFINNKLSGVGDLTELLPRLISMSGGDFISKKDLDSLMVTLKRNLAHASWMDLYESLRREDYRDSLAGSITPASAELITLLASSEVQQRLYEAAIPRTQALLASYGMPGITLDNFPERVAPIMGLMTKGWNLSFKPTAFLVPLRDYLKDLREWISEGLTSIRDLPSKEHVQGAVRTTLKDVGDEVMGLAKETQGAKTECLPLLLCRINRAPSTPLVAAITRTASLVFGAGPALEEPDSTILMKIVQAASGKVDNCEEVFSEGCTNPAAHHVDLDQTYKHQEL